MENAKLPYISVIITAYNRKEFLLSAIKSVLNQTLDKKYYEIIVIKNFQDKNIDNFINENKIKHILMEGTMGEFLYKGISEANGEIISFLDDDDLFFENKLDIVYKEFKKDNNIVYYHNWCVPRNRNGKILNTNSINNSPDINMSAIAIKTSIVKIDQTNKINISMAPDILMYLCALESNKEIIEGKEKLTYYMLHNSTSNIVSKNFEEYRKFVINRADLDLTSYKLFNSLFHSEKTINYLTSLTTGEEINKYILGSNKFPNELINYIKNGSGSLKFKVESILACVLIKVYPNSRKYISNKMWNNYNKRFSEAA